MTGSSAPARDRGPASANVLVVAAGRRTSLVRAFLAAAGDRGGRVVAGDVDGLAPALFIADEAVRTPRTADPDYVDALLEIVQRASISLVVPTIDTDLPVLARAADRFAGLGCRVAISEPAFIDTTVDKWTTGVAFAAQGIATPRAWLPPVADAGKLPERVVVKPRDGSASIDVHFVDRDRVAAVLPMVPNAMIQERLTGSEITIDALVDFDGRPIHFVPRRRIKTVGGESVEGVTLDHDASLEGWISGVLHASARLGGRGPLTLQAFLTPDGPVLTEINARFGGGYPLALAAGAAYPTWLLDLVAGRPVPARLGDYEPGVYMTRSLVEHITRRPFW